MKLCNFKSLVLFTSLFVTSSLQARSESFLQFLIDTNALLQGDHQVAVKVLSANEVIEAGLGNADQIGLLNGSKNFIVVRYAVIASQPAEFFSAERISDNNFISAIQSGATVESTVDPMVKQVTTSLKVGPLAISSENRLVNLAVYEFATQKLDGALTMESANNLGALNPSLGYPNRVTYVTSQPMGVPTLLGNSVGTESYYSLNAAQTLVIGVSISQVGPAAEGPLFKYAKGLVEDNLGATFAPTMRFYQSL